MKTALTLLTLLGGLVGCTPDETLTGYAPQGIEYRLTELDGAPFPAHATLSFGENGQISGQAPCNSYFSTVTAPYPWFGLDAIGATRRACSDL